MKSLVRLLTLISGLSLAAGCSICESPYDDTYNAFGGKWERLDMLHGRVGSAFDPAEAATATDEAIDLEPPPMADGPPLEEDLR